MSKETTIKNLKILLTAWQRVDFDPEMEEFGGINWVSLENLQVGDINYCGTGCSALGFAPNVKGLEISEEDFSLGSFSYHLYSQRVFPYLYIGDSRSWAWDYMFGAQWPNNRLALVHRLTKIIQTKLKVTSSMKEEYVVMRAKQLLPINQFYE